MSYKVENFLDNDDVNILFRKGPFTAIEYVRDLSCTPQDAMVKYYMAKSKVTKKQLVIELKNDTIVLQSGAMQWIAGNVSQTSGIKGAGDFIGKMFSSKVTGESVVKPEYSGNGIIVTEPTYKHFLLQDLKEWNGSIVLQDGLFVACEKGVKMKTVARENLSSAVAGGEGMFNLCLSGEGVFALESIVPDEELIYIALVDDVLKVDGPYAIAWSSSLKFTVERSGKSLVGSAASGEGLVNVYRGTGRVLLMPQV